MSIAEECLKHAENCGLLILDHRLAGDQPERRRFMRQQQQTQAADETKPKT